MEQPSNRKSKPFQIERLRKDVDMLRMEVKTMRGIIDQAMAVVQAVRREHNTVAAILPPAGSIVAVAPMTFPRRVQADRSGSFNLGWIPLDGRSASTLWYKREDVPEMWDRFERAGKPSEDHTRIGEVDFFRVREYGGTGASAGTPTQGQTRHLIFAGVPVVRAFRRSSDGSGALTMSPTQLVTTG